MKPYFAPLAAVALLSVGACADKNAAENAAAENAVIETNLTSLDEPLANDTTLGNDVALPGDAITLNETALNAADPVVNGTGL